MRAGEVAQRYWLCPAPSHRHGRGVSITHDALAQDVDAVFVVIAVVGHLPVREVRKVVGRVHEAMESFLKNVNQRCGSRFIGGLSYKAVKLVEDGQCAEVATVG